LRGFHIYVSHTNECKLNIRLTKNRENEVFGKVLPEREDLRRVTPPEGGLREAVGVERISCLMSVIQMNVN
jgi:hypothetical protein